jgi:hypothetical protein
VTPLGPAVHVEVIIAQALAPMHKRALGVAVGGTAAASLFLLTVFHVVVQPAGLPIELLSFYFYGYDVSWRGACVGAWWAFVAGFVGGWFIAFLRNLAVAVRIAVLRARHDLRQTSSLLDHI